MLKITAKPDAHRRTLIKGGIALGVTATGTGLYALRQRANAAPAHPGVLLGQARDGTENMVWVPGGEFSMGSDHKLAQANERPVHRVRLAGFWMDRTHVTNAQFARFVEATGYVTTAEKSPTGIPCACSCRQARRGPLTRCCWPGPWCSPAPSVPLPWYDYAQWWEFVPGANWRHPHGPGSDLQGKQDHPVVQVSFEDAQACARWSGKRLPGEVEWEFAARGGLEQATYAWGDEQALQGQLMAHIWEARKRRFPVVSPKAGGAVDTVACGSFPANGWGLYDMTGNAWQWTHDWYRADHFARLVRQHGRRVILQPTGPVDAYDPSEAGVPVDAPKRTIRGGSFLCNEDYCLSYRPSARRGNDPFSPMSHLGFRLVKT